MSLIQYRLTANVTCLIKTEVAGDYFSVLADIAPTCFSCRPPDLNSVVTNCLLSYYVK